MTNGFGFLILLQARKKKRRAKWVRSNIARLGASYCASRGTDGGLSPASSKEMQPDLHANLDPHCSDTQCRGQTPLLAAERGPVKSLLEMRRDRVVVQKWDLSCGAAALATLLNYQHGDPVPEREIAKVLIQRGIPCRSVAG